MLDRESTFADADIVQMLKTEFIPVAIDQAYQRRQQDAEGDFYRKIAGKGPRNDFKGTTQGLYVATGGGEFLGFTNNRGADRVKKLMSKAKEDFRSDSTTVIDAGKLDQRYNPQPPEGGLVLRARAKILSGYPETDDPWKQIFQTSLSRDNVWITKAEAKAIAQGKILKQVQKRIAKYHFVDNTRGEPPFWKDEDIREIEMQIKDGQITGSVLIKNASNDRGYEAKILGNLETQDGKVSKLNFITRGDFWGEGQYTKGAPQGKFPLAIAFELADQADVADKIPPQGSRGWVKGYLEN